MGGLKRILGAVIAVAFLAALAMPAKADDVALRKTTFTFSGPVELPGVSLPAGTYVFKLANTRGNHNIVQVFDKTEKKVYGAFITIPVYRSQGSDETIVRFSETASNAPPAIKEWFYPGSRHDYGLEFVYPKPRAVELAKAANEPVPSMPENLTSEVTKPKPNIPALLNAPLKAEEPSGEEVEVAEAFPPQATAQAPAERAPARLPKTASTLPLLALTGIGLVTVGTLLWAFRKRVA